MGVWTFIGAVIRFYGWFGDARGVYIIIFIGTMGFAATQLIVGILGIVVLFQRQRQQRQGPQTALTAMLLGHRARVFPRLASSAGLGVVVGWHKDWWRSQSYWPPPSAKRTTLPTRSAGARHPDL